MHEWTNFSFSDFVEINPKIKLEKGIKYSFVEMADLESHNKFCEPKKLRELTGGMRFQNGDTLFARITPCLENGKICQVRNLINGHGFGSTEFHVLRGKQEVSDSNFIFYLSRWNEVKDFAELNLHGTSGRQRMPHEAFKELQLTLPPLPEQQAIAEVLSSLDDKIDLLHRNNKTLEEMAETLFRQWFVEGAKEEWEEVTIGSLCKRITKGTTPTTLGKSFKDSGVNFIKAESIEDHGGFIKSKFAFIDQDTHNLLLRSQLEEGDVLYTIAGTIGRTAIVTKGILPANTNQAVAILKPDSEKISNLFLKYLMKSDIITEVLESKIVHAVQPNLSLGEISSTQLKMPAEDVMSKFNTISESISLKINSNVNELTILINLRDLLLPKLMSGQVRVITDK